MAASIAGACAGEQVAQMSQVRERMGQKRGAEAPMANKPLVKHEKFGKRRFVRRSRTFLNC
jgi:hypothetical protein